MSAIGPKRKYACALHMSASDPKRILVLHRRSALWRKKGTLRGRQTLRNVNFHQGHGHVSLMACITPVRAFVGHFSRCWFAFSLKASTIASFDTDDFGHAEGIDLNIKSEGSLMCFNASPFVKA